MSGRLAACLFAAAVGCGGPERASVALPEKDAAAPESKVEAFPVAAERWERVPARGARLELPLPAQAPWRHREAGGEATFTQASSRSSVRARLVADAAWMDRARCEARADVEGYAPPVDAALVEEDSVLLGPGVSARVRVFAGGGGARAEGPPKDLAGTLLLVGAMGRRCWFVRFDTQVPAGEDEALSSRLATVRARFVPGIVFEEPGESPRDAVRPGPRRGD